MQGPRSWSSQSAPVLLSDVLQGTEYCTVLASGRVKELLQELQVLSDGGELSDNFWLAKGGGEKIQNIGACDGKGN